MTRRNFVLAICSLLIALLGLFTGCVQKDPVDVLVLEKVQTDLAANHDAAIMTNITKWEVFKQNLKIWLADDYPHDKIEDLTKVVAKTFGTISRTNGKIENTYVVQVFQKRKNDTSGEEKVYNIAMGEFFNGKETVNVELFGLGDGKYDY